MSIRIQRSAPLIGLMGAAGAGKDSLADCLTNPDAWNTPYTRLAFADTLKNAVLSINPLVDSDGPWTLAELVALHGWDEAKREYPEVRRLLQATGAAMRELSPSIWTSPVTEALMRMGQGTPVVITDVRMPNEIMALRLQGGLLVHVVRDGAGLAGELATHESETAWTSAEPDAVVHNDGTLEDLAALAYELNGWAWSRTAAGLEHPRVFAV